MDDPGLRAAFILRPRPLPHKFGWSFVGRRSAGTTVLRNETTTAPARPRPPASSFAQFTH